MLPEKRVISKYYVTTGSKIKSGKEWYRIWIDSVKTQYYINRKGDVKNEWTDKILLPIQINNGLYWSYQLRVNGRRVVLSKHRLLACIFIPIPKRYRDLGYAQEHLEVNHKDKDKTNFELTNLEWVLPIENVRHSDLTPDVLNNKYCREMTKGNTDEDIQKYRNNSKITEETARQICEMLQAGFGISKIAKEFKVSNFIVSSIKHRNTWTDISKDYHFVLNKPLPDKSNFVRRSSISEDTARSICEMLQGGIDMQSISSELGVSTYIISKIRNGKTWKNISKDYSFVNDISPESKRGDYYVIK